MSRPVSFSDIDVDVDAPPANGGGSGVYVTEVLCIEVVPLLCDFLFRGIDVQGFALRFC